MVKEPAAGIDIASRFHVAAVSPDSDDEPVRTVGTFTGDLHRLADGHFSSWLGISPGNKFPAQRCGGKVLRQNTEVAVWFDQFLFRRGRENLDPSSRYFVPMGLRDGPLRATLLPPTKELQCHA